MGACLERGFALASLARCHQSSQLGLVSSVISLAWCHQSSHPQDCTHPCIRACIRFLHLSLLFLDPIALPHCHQMVSLILLVPGLRRSITFTKNTHTHTHTHTHMHTHTFTRTHTHAHAHAHTHTHTHTHTRIHIYIHAHAHTIHTHAGHSAFGRGLHHLWSPARPCGRCS